MTVAWIPVELSEKIQTESLSISEDFLTEKGSNFLGKNVIDAQIPNNDPEKITLSAQVTLFKESVNNETTRRNSQLIENQEKVKTEQSAFSEDENKTPDLSKNSLNAVDKSKQKSEELSPDERDFLNSRVKIIDFPLIFLIII